MSAAARSCGKNSSTGAARRSTGFKAAVQAALSEHVAQKRFPVLNFFEMRHWKVETSLRRGLMPRAVRQDLSQPSSPCASRPRVARYAPPIGAVGALPSCGWLGQNTRHKQVIPNRPWSWSERSCQSAEQKTLWPHGHRPVNLGPCGNRPVRAGFSRLAMPAAAVRRCSDG